MRKLINKYLFLACLLPVIAFAEPEPSSAPPPDDGMAMGGGGRHGREMGGGKHPGMQDKLLKLFDELGMSDTQKQQAKDLLRTQMAGMHEHFKAEHEARKGLRDLAFSNDYSDAKAKELLAKLLQAQEQVMLKKAQMDNALFKLLTPEQQQQLQQRMSKKPPSPPGDERPEGEAPPKQP